MRPAIEVVSDIDSEFPCVKENCAVCSKAAAVIESDREALVREIIKHLNDESNRCDCGARDADYCACGGLRGYRIASLPNVADEIEHKFLGKDARW